MPQMCLLGLSNLLASLGHTRRRRVVSGHTLNTQTLTKTDEQKKVLSKFTILCWEAFIAILDHMWPTGYRVDTPIPSLHDPPKIIIATFSHQFPHLKCFHPGTIAPNVEKSQCLLSEWPQGEVNIQEEISGFQVKGRILNSKIQLAEARTN